MIIESNSNGYSSERALAVIPAALSTRPNPLSLLKALERRWPIALVIALVLGIIAAAAGWFFLPPGKYTARTLLTVPPPRPFMFGTREHVLNLPDHQRNQLAMARSRLVLVAALKLPGISQLPIVRKETDPVEWLERELQADFAVAPEVLRLAIAGDSPQELVQLINAVRKAYQDEILDKEKVDRANRITWIGTTRAKYEAQLKTLKEEQIKLLGKSGGRDPAVRSQLIAFMYLQLDSRQRELIQIQSELRRARADLQVSQQNENGVAIAPVPDSLLDEYLNREPLVVEARSNIQRLQANLEASLKVAKQGEQDPTIRQTRQQIAAAEGSLTALRKRLSPAAADEIRNKMRHDYGRSIQLLNSRIAVLTEEDQVLSLGVEKIRTEISEKSEKGERADFDFEFIRDTEKVVREFQKEEESLKIEMNAPDRNRLLEENVVTKPRETQRVLMVSGGAGLGTFGLVMLGFALFEFRARRVKSPDELTTGLGLPMVGAIPDIRYMASPALAPDSEQSILNEAVDTIRTMLLRADQIDPLRVLLVTSAQSGEGKTSLSTRLSTSLAQIGFRTLLIDGDLRHPIVHKMFNMDRGQGFCDLLRGEVTMDEVIRPTEVNQLSILSAGAWNGTATRALAQDDARRLMDTFRSRFDFVIIDSSPVLPVVDPLLLGQYADGAILSVLRDVSRMPNIYAAYQRLTMGGVRVLGAVMSGVRGDPYRTYYPYGELTGQPAAQQKLAGTS